jgi:hypothetical protein
VGGAWSTRRARPSVGDPAGRRHSSACTRAGSPSSTPRRPTWSGAAAVRPSGRERRCQPRLVAAGGGRRRWRHHDARPCHPAACEPAAAGARRGSGEPVVLAGRHPARSRRHRAHRRAVGRCPTRARGPPDAGQTHHAGGGPGAPSTGTILAANQHSGIWQFDTRPDGAPALRAKLILLRDPRGDGWRGGTRAEALCHGRRQDDRTSMRPRTRRSRPSSPKPARTPSRSRPRHPIRTNPVT